MQIRPKHLLEAILWDLDGTLALTHDLYHQSNRAAAAQFGLQLPDTFWIEIRGMSDKTMWRHLRKQYNLPASEESWASANAEQFRRFLSLLKPRSGARETWRFAESSGISQGIVTAGNMEDTIDKLSALGIYHENLVVITSDHVRLSKPHRESYRLAARKLGVRPPNCVVIEDSPRGARSGLVAGMRVIGWGDDKTVFPKGTVTIQPEEGPLELIQQWHRQLIPRRTVRQLPLTVRIGLQGIQDRGETVRATVSEQAARLRRP
jgi:HAD superfamily hydrolase (TIGR01509 family)